MKHIKLNSVGSIIDTETKIVYPQNGRLDLNCGNHFTDCPKEWYESLDKYDKQIIYNLLIEYCFDQYRQNKRG